MKSFKFGSGGLEGWDTYELKGNEIVYEPWSQLEILEIKEEAPSDFQEKICNIIKDWDKEYNNPYILDGLQWELNAEFDNGTKIESCGSNKYPDNFNELMKYLYKITGQEWADSLSFENIDIEDKKPEIQLTTEQVENILPAIGYPFCNMSKDFVIEENHIEDMLIRIDYQLRKKYNSKMKDVRDYIFCEYIKKYPKEKRPKQEYTDYVKIVIEKEKVDTKKYSEATEEDIRKQLDSSSWSHILANKGNMNKKYFNIVKKHIDKLNPYGLLPECPKDEFDTESLAIADKIDENTTIKEIAGIIQEILGISFGREDFKDIEVIYPYAVNIYSDIHREWFKDYSYLEEKYPVLKRLKCIDEIEQKPFTYPDHEDDEKKAIKLIDILNCDYIEFTEKDKIEDVINKYEELLADGEKNNYTPIIIYKDDTFVNFMCRYNLAYKKENYKEYIKRILADAERIEKNDLWQELMIQYFLDACVNDEDRIERIVNCLEEPDNTYLNYYTDYLKVLNKEVVEKPANIDEEGTTRNLYNDLAIVKIPTNKPYEVFAWIPMGGFNWCPDPHYHIAVAKYFYENYGAIPMFIGGCVNTFYLKEPIKDKEKAKQLAKEMVIYDDDFYSELMEALDSVLGAKSWHFWWD